MRDLLRKVLVHGYNGRPFVLSTFDTGRSDSMGKSILAYTLADERSGDVVFDGADFACSPIHSIDSDSACRGILTFLTLRLGDTDREYFKDYTPEQIAFRDTHAETMSMYTDPEYALDNYEP